MEINSKAYWEQRFSSTNWNQQGGPEQSRRFMNLLLDHLMIDLSGVSVCDIGCAQGEGTAVIQEHYPDALLSGCDISPSAIATAQQHHPAIHFFACDFVDDFPQDFEVIVTSNTLEHITNLDKAIAQLLSHCQWLVILVPYQQYHPDGRLLSPDHPLGEHVHTFETHSFNDYLVFDSLIIPIPQEYWSIDGSQQILYLIKGDLEAH
jgi:trans-aconitate methyltransferase